MREYIDTGSRGAKIEYSDTPLTKREYFAALAMQGFMAARGAHHTYDYVVAWSVKLADALIEELNKSKDNQKTIKRQSKDNGTD